MVLLMSLLTSTLVYADLDKTIEQVAPLYGVKPQTMKAIAMIESSYGKNIGPRVNKNGTKDIGPFQINTVHVNQTCKKYDVYTLDGNARCAARLIMIAKKYCNKDPYCLGRYHSKTPSKKIKYYNKIKHLLAGL